VSALRAPAVRAKLGRGFVAIAGMTTLMLILGTLGWDYIALFAGVGIGILVGGWAADVDSDPPLILGFLGLPGFALSVLMIVDISVIGIDRGTVALDDLGRGILVTAVRFTDARVAEDYSGDASVSSRGGTTTTGRWYVAPIVSKDWTPDKPVRAWAVARTSVYGPTGIYGPQEWSRDHRGGVFFSTSIFDEVSEARDWVIGRYKLNASGHEPLLYWVANPYAVVAEQCWLVLAIMLGAFGIWVLVVAGDAVIRRRPVAA